MYSCLTDDNCYDKKAKGTKKYVIKWQIKFKDNKNCQVAHQLENDIIYLENNKDDVDKLKENHKEFLKGNILILKSHQRSKSEAGNIFNVEVKKVALSANDYKRFQSTDCKESYAHATSENIIRKNEDTKYRNMITLILLELKASKNIIQIGVKFFIIHSEY